MEGAVKVLTPSEFSRRVHRGQLTIWTEVRIIVVPIAMSPTRSDRSRGRSAAVEVESRFGIAGPYILTVGDLQPRKNQIGLIRAFEELHSQIRTYRTSCHCRSATWFSDHIQSAREIVRSVANRIHFTGFVND